VSARRYANGRTICNAAIGGTPELLIKRARMVGERNDPVLSTTPVDVMRARGIIGEDEQRAGAWFGGLARIVLGKPYGYDVLNETRGSEPTDEVVRRVTVAYAFVCETLEAHARGELIDILHFRIFPPWLIKTVNNGTALRAGDVAARARALAALSRLAYVYARWRGAGLPAAAE
jgi:hypothetical protein